jgi:hypothetical protein
MSHISVKTDIAKKPYEIILRENSEKRRGSTEPMDPTPPFEILASLTSEGLRTKEQRETRAQISCRPSMLKPSKAHCFRRRHGQTRRPIHRTQLQAIEEALHDACIDERNACRSKDRNLRDHPAEAMDSPPTLDGFSPTRPFALSWYEDTNGFTFLRLNQLTTPTKRQMDPWIQDCQRNNSHDMYLPTHS